MPHKTHWRKGDGIINEFIKFKVIKYKVKDGMKIEKFDDILAWQKSQELTFARSK